MALRIAAPPRDVLRRHRRRRPGVHDVGVADEPARFAALVLTPPAWRRGQRIEREVGGLGEDRVLLVRSRPRARIPRRERHAGEALAAHAPVLVQALDPVLVAGAHMCGVPLDAPPLLEQLALMSRMRTNHWRVGMNSSGRSPFSLNLTGCSTGLGSPISAASPPTTRYRAAPAARSLGGALARPTCRPALHARWAAPDRGWRTARCRSRRRRRPSGATS